MARIHPFRGVRFVADRAGSIDDVVAPPYDVISPDQRRQLGERSPWNVVHADLPTQIHSAEAGEARYDRAGDTWRSWRSDGIAARDADPAIYVIEERFTTPMGEQGVRHGFVAALELEELGADTVAPHERTYDGPKADRLRLMRATRANLSQVFALYHDPDRVFDAMLERLVREPSDLSVEASDGHRRMWVVTDLDTIRAAQDTLASSPLTIADGHHRYETALTYRDEARAAGEPSGAESLMVYLSNIDDPHLAILPYHRYVKFSDALDVDAYRQHMEDAFEIEPVGLQDPIPLLRSLIGSGTGEPYRFGLYTRHWGWELATLRDHAAVADLIGAGHTDVWRRLDAAVLHAVLLGELPRRATVDAEPLAAIWHTADPRIAAEAVREEEADMFCMVRATAPEQIGEVIRAGDTMPQKSTYFYPKLLTGLVMRDLEQPDMD